MPASSQTVYLQSTHTMSAGVECKLSMAGNAQPHAHNASGGLSSPTGKQCAAQSSTQSCQCCLLSHCGMCAGAAAGHNSCRDVPLQPHKAIRTHLITQGLDGGVGLCVRTAASPYVATLAVKSPSVSSHAVAPLSRYTESSQMVVSTTFSPVPGMVASTSRVPILMYTCGGVVSAGATLTSMEFWLLGEGVVEPDPPGAGLKLSAAVRSGRQIPSATHVPSGHATPGAGQAASSAGALKYTSTV